jgi:hypothetical protein
MNAFQSAIIFGTLASGGLPRRVRGRVTAMPPFFNVSTRRVGGIRFLKIGRLTLAFAVARAYRPIGERPQ